MYTPALGGIYPKIYRKVSLNMVKEDQLRTIVLMKKVLLKMVAMATSHSLLRF